MQARYVIFNCLVTFENSKTGEINSSNTLDLTQYIQNITLPRNQFAKLIKELFFFFL